MKGFVLLCAAAGGVLAGGCSRHSSADMDVFQDTRPVYRPAPQAAPVAEWISAADAHEKMRTTPDLFILCVADKPQYDRGHIAGSVLIPAMSLADHVDNNRLWQEINQGRVPRRGQPVLVYCWWKPCECPSIPTYSQMARKILLNKGFRQVYLISGGMPAWMKAALPTQQGGDFASR